MSIINYCNDTLNVKCLYAYLSIGYKLKVDPEQKIYGCKIKLKKKMFGVCDFLFY